MPWAMRSGRCVEEFSSGILSIRLGALFMGLNISTYFLKTEITRGIEVVSLSRSERPSYIYLWVNQVTWVASDVLYAY
jgi:hypothetical protein